MIKKERISIKRDQNIISLDYPKIISYIDSFFDEESKTLSIIMEYAENGDFSKNISSLKQKISFYRKSNLEIYNSKFIKDELFI